MQQKFREQGLVCMSVSVDPADNKPQALDFLKAQKALFPNFWLDEEFEVWSQKLNITSPPALFVFDRAGRRAGKFYAPDKEYTDEDVEKLVQQLLQAKP